MQKINFIFNWQSVLLILNAIVTLYAGVVLWLKRERPGALALSLLMFVTALWAAATGAHAALSVNLSQAKQLLLQLLHLSYTFVGPLFLLFSFHYCSLRYPRPARSLQLWILPAANAFLIIFFPRLIFTGSSFVAGSNTYLKYSFSPWFLIYFVYTMILYALGTFLMFRKLSELSRVFRGQILLLIVGFSFPALTGLLFVLGFDIHLKMDFSSIGFSFTAIVVTILLFRYKLFDLTLVGREVMLEKIPDAYLITDLAFSVSDFNSRAALLFRLKAANDFHKSIGDLIPEISPLLPEAPRPETATAEVKIADSHFELRIIPLQREFNLGYLFLFHDITASKLQSLERERLIAELQRADNRISKLQSMLPVCSWCRKIRNEQGEWQMPEKFLATSRRQEVSHIICPECELKLKGDL